MIGKQTSSDTRADRSGGIEHGQDRKHELAIGQQDCILICGRPDISHPL